MAKTIYILLIFIRKRSQNYNLFLTKNRGIYCLMEDNYLHKGRRDKLVKKLEGKGITDKAVLKAIQAVPRHFFLDKIFEHHAYEDKPFSIGEKQTISQPYTVAFQTQLLELKKSDKVLEIGTGSGYQTSVLLQISKNIYSIERIGSLHVKARNLLHKKLNYKVNLKLGDGTLGWAENAPYNKIIVTAGATKIPQPLLDQLDINGVLIIPVGDESNQIMHRVHKLSKEKYEYETFSQFSFVPLLRDTQ